MIDWREHIQAIRPEAPKSGYVWVAYQSRSPYLPVAVADTAAELARIVGVPRAHIVDISSHANRRLRDGKFHHARFMCVCVGT